MALENAGIIRDVISQLLFKKIADLDRGKWMPQ